MGTQEWVRFATMTLQEGKIHIDFEDGFFEDGLDVVYAWKTPEGEFLRFGTAENLKKRLQRYQNDINNSLHKGNHKSTPLEEAKKWETYLRQHNE